LDGFIKEFDDIYIEKVNSMIFYDPSVSNSYDVLKTVVSRSDIIVNGIMYTMVLQPIRTWL